MQILSLILDGNGRLSAELCLSPNLRRREMVAATGGGELVWCGLAARSQKPGEVLAELRDYIEARNLDRWDHAALRVAVRKAYLVTVIRPGIKTVKGRMRRVFLRSIATPVRRLISGIAGARRTP